jgi:hypothetical protein
MPLAVYLTNGGMIPAVSVRIESAALPDLGVIWKNLHMEIRADSCLGNER